MTGTRPVIDFMFAASVLDGVGEVVNQIAKVQYMSGGRIKMPILLRRCIGVGHSAATHYSGNYYPLFAQFAGLRVVVPSTPYDAKGLMHHALRCDDPVVFLEHRELLALKDPVPEAAYEIPLGRAAVAREGADVTVVALARMARLALDACAELEREGVSVELIDPRTVAPLDVVTIGWSVAKTGRVLIADEAFAPLGVGVEVAARVRERDVAAHAPSTVPSRGRIVPLTPVRRAIAARMVESLRTAAPVTLTSAVDVTNLVNLRGQYKAVAAGGPVPSYTDFVVKLTTVALQKHPPLAARWTAGYTRDC